MSDDQQRPRLRREERRELRDVFEDEQPLQRERLGANDPGTVVESETDGGQHAGSPVPGAGETDGLDLPTDDIDADEFTSTDASSFGGAIGNVGTMIDRTLDKVRDLAEHTLDKVGDMIDTGISVGTKAVEYAAGAGGNAWENAAGGGSSGHDGGDDGDGDDGDGGGGGGATDGDDGDHISGLPTGPFAMTEADDPAPAIDLTLRDDAPFHGGAPEVDMLDDAGDVDLDLDLDG